MTRTHLILDGLQDPKLAQTLSKRWMEAGYENAVDPCGMSGWVSKSEAEKRAKPQAELEGGRELTEKDVDRAAAVARGVGVEVRDRVGSTFKAANDLDAMRKQLAYEYKSRFATALMFGLPAIALHYVGPVLSGGGSESRRMVYPWMFEMVLVGWACLAAGWPILWQGALALLHLRATGDLLTAVAVVVPFAASALALFSMSWRVEPMWLGLEHGGPLFYASMFAMILAVLQRWLAHRAAARLGGRATLLLSPFGRLVFAWLVFATVIACTRGAGVGLAVALLLPPMISLGAVNRWSPGWSMVLPVVAFAVVLLLGSRVLPVKSSGVEIEIAVGFQLMMVVVMGLGWRGGKKVSAG